MWVNAGIGMRRAMALEEGPSTLSTTTLTVRFGALDSLFWSFWLRLRSPAPLPEDTSVIDVIAVDPDAYERVVNMVCPDPPDAPDASDPVDIVDVLDTLDAAEVADAAEATNATDVSKADKVVTWATPAIAAVAVDVVGSLALAEAAAGPENVRRTHGR
jgi:hypothetical protein